VAIITSSGVITSRHLKISTPYTILEAKSTLKTAPFRQVISLYFGLTNYSRFTKTILLNVLLSLIILSLLL